jgi:hypothetical protein
MTTGPGLIPGDGAKMALDKAKGIVFDAAIGDALGYPTEFLSLDQIKSRLGSQGIRDLPEPALFSDDTQMTIAVAEALIEAGHGNLYAIMEAIKNEFVKWRHSPENSRAPGNTCLAGVSNMERRIHWSESGVPDSKAADPPCGLRTSGIFTGKIRKSSKWLRGPRASAPTAAEERWRLASAPHTWSS